MLRFWRTRAHVLVFCLGFASLFLLSTTLRAARTLHAESQLGLPQFPVDGLKVSSSRIAIFAEQWPTRCMKGPKGSKSAITFF